MDFAARSRLRAAMEDAQDLIDRLCTAAGMLMEDVSAIATLRDQSLSPDARIVAIASAASDLAALAAAAGAISHRWLKTSTHPR